MTARAQRVAAVILAAGGSHRYGGLKLLAPLAGRPLLQHVLDAANASTLDDVLLVVGHAADEILAAVQLERARAVVNPAYASGQASSLCAGIAAAADADAVVVLLGDQPLVRPELLGALVERQRTSGAAAVMSSWEGRRSPPTLLHRDLWPALGALTGDLGAREVLAGRDDVAIVEVDERLGRLVDVDRPEDLRRLTDLP